MCFLVPLSADIPGSGAVGSGSVAGSLLLSLPAGVPRAVEAGSVAGSLLLSPCSYSATTLHILTAIITAIIISSPNIIAIFHPVYVLLCWLPLSAPSVLLSPSLSCSLFLSPQPAEADGRPP